MSLATLDRVIAVLIIGMAGTGLMSLRAGMPTSSWVFALHGVLGGALLVAVAWKLRRSVPRALDAGRWRSLALALVVAVVTLSALAGGFLWMAAGGAPIVGSWTILTLHAWLGLALLPLVGLHLLPRRWRVLRPAGSRVAPRAVSRRSFLAAGGLALTGIGTYVSVRLIEFVRGGEHRFTGSRWLPSGGIPPPTTFYGERPVPIDSDGWRLDVVGRDGLHRSLSMADLGALRQIERSTVLDCTSGWALETTWSGVTLRTVLETVGPPPTHGSVRVTSTTGWSTVLAAGDAADVLLATGVAGRSLPIQNGAPCRLVVPGGRGLEWVKWVTEVRLV